MDSAAARAKLIDQLRREIKDERMLGAMAQVPRELFLPPDEQPFAYEDRPLPIGWGQTISQPFIIALMTSALELNGEETVLEVGTGSGYQSAILSLLVKRVISVERMLPLAEEARGRLQSLGYDNVQVYNAGKALGWPDLAPYDAIIVTAGAPRLPSSLVQQLRVGGRLVIPIGSRYDQELWKVVRGEKSLHYEGLGACRFVPLLGPEAWPEAENGI